MHKVHAIWPLQACIWVRCNADCYCEAHRDAAGVRTPTVIMRSGCQGVCIIDTAAQFGLDRCWLVRPAQLEGVTLGEMNARKKNKNTVRAACCRPSLDCDYTLHTDYFPAGRTRQRRRPARRRRRVSIQLGQLFEANGSRALQAASTRTRPTADASTKQPNKTSKA